VAEDHHLRLVEARADDVHQLIKVRKELLDRHRRRLEAPVKRSSSPALLPVNDREGRFQRRVEVPEERRFGHPWPAVEDDQGRVGDVLAANHHPLIDSAQSHQGGLGDAARKPPAVGRAKGRRVSEMDHATSA
jgi:hypothetical protein